MKTIKKITAAIALVATMFGAVNTLKVHASEEYWYQVQKGETYYSISNEFGIDVSDFDEEIKLKADSKIIIPGYVLEPHKIVKGDTVHNLAKAYNSKEQWILMANDMEEDDKIILDHYILIPIKDDSEELADEKQDANTPTGGKSEEEKSGKLQGDSQEKIEKVVPVESSKSEKSVESGKQETGETKQILEGEYIIQKGDSLMSISRKLNVTLKQLLSWNPSIKNPNMIFAGRKIKITGTTPSAITLIENTESETKIECDFSGLQSMIDHYKVKYDGLRIGVGIYSLSESKYLYRNNVNAQISCGCTVKAAYAAYVLQQCTKYGYDLDSTMIMYRDYMMNTGSGRIKNMEVNQEFSVRVLLTHLLEISDNTAYNILLSKFNLAGYQEFLNQFDGQQLNGCRFGSCSVNQRMNEWLMILNYCHSTDPNGKVLEKMLESAKYSYLAQGFSEYHSYLHKSGWADGTSYNSCSDAIVVDNKYIIVVISDDYNGNIAHTDVVRNIGSWCDNNMF